VFTQLHFESIFIDDNIKNQYAAERRTSMMLSICTVIALIISYLGLYGLSVYIAERRMKEIGVRKVVGASIIGIVRMLSKDYVKLLVISFTIAWLTVSFESVKAAKRNPVDTLKRE